MAQGVFAAGTRPLVISHAGCAGKAPENTLAGIRAALELQVDAIEVDVRASADGIPVLLHDATLERTTNGRGLVADATLAELTALDAGGARAVGRAAPRRPPTSGPSKPAATTRRSVARVTGRASGSGSKWK